MSNMRRAIEDKLFYRRTAAQAGRILPEATQFLHRAAKFVAPTRAADTCNRIVLPPLSHWNPWRSVTAGMRVPQSALAFMLAVLGGPALLRAQSREDYENPPVNYSATAPNDAAKKIETRLAAGTLQLTGTDKEIVTALLREFGAPVSSQVLVFSKTSFQRDRINPDHPRALYFSDDCYIGWVPGGLVEVTTIDPTLGPVFYTFDPRARTANPRFVRDSDCLRCHGGAFVREVPAVFVRSVFPDVRGDPLLRHGTVVVDYRTPFEQQIGRAHV